MVFLIPIESNRGVGHMKNFILCGVSAVALVAATPVLAADMPIKAPPPVVPAFSWTGVYVGGFVGAAWSRFTSSTGPESVCRYAPPTSCAPIFPFSEGFSAGAENATAPIGGIVSGINLQFWGPLVIGGEWLTAGTRLISHSSAVGDLNDDFTIFTTSKIGYITTVAGRIGLAWDRVLFFAKGGWATAERDTVSHVNG